MLLVPSFGGLDNSTMRGELAECERKSLHARTQKLDLERSIDDPTPAPFGDDKIRAPDACFHIFSIISDTIP
jgi:hypothetical protein